MNDLIKRQDAIDAIVEELDRIDHVPKWVFDALKDCLKKVTPATSCENCDKETI